VAERERLLILRSPVIAATASDGRDWRLCTLGPACAGRDCTKQGKNGSCPEGEFCRLLPPGHLVDILTSANLTRVLARNICLTGLPRAGTTLTCELLGGLPNCVGLDEPLDRKGFIGEQPSTSRSGWLSRKRVTGQPAEPDHRRIVANIEQFFADTRRSILEQRVAISKHVDGRVFASKIADATGPEGTRIRLARRGEISITKPLTSDFTLVVKHNSAFAGVLDELAKALPVFAIVRNPLSVLASWQTVPIPVHRGHASLAEAFDPGLAAELSRMPDTLDRQLHLVGWFFERFVRVLPPQSILRYEDIVGSDGQMLEVIQPSAAGRSVPLASRNQAKVYDEGTMRKLGERLLAAQGAYWGPGLYSRDDVAELLSV